MSYNRITQLILDGRVYMPRRSRDQYSASEEILGTNLQMISGRMVKELAGDGQRYKVWRVRCTYDALDERVYLDALEILRSGKSFPAAFLPDNGRELVSATMMVESMTPATFAFQAGNRPVWHGLSICLREVAPHA